jgi:hypothetical protein
LCHGLHWTGQNERQAYDEAAEGRHPSLHDVKVKNLGKYRVFFLIIQKMTVFFTFFRRFFGKSGQNALSLQQIKLFILQNAYILEENLPSIDRCAIVIELCYGRE